MAKTASDQFLESLAASLDSLGLSAKGKYLIGVSGGPDSVALLHGLHRCGFRRLVVCHLDHHLRGGVAAADACFVSRLAKELDLACHSGGADVGALAKERKESIETAARTARHEFFAECAKKERCAKVFLGHHRGDQIETVLHHFFRGSGRKGLGGMQARSQAMVGRRKVEFLRPFLGIEKEEITNWLRENQLSWREDASNTSADHARNRLRHQLIPRLEEMLGRNFRNTVLRLSTILAEEDEFLESLLAPEEESEMLEVGELREMPLALRRRRVLRWLKKRIGGDVGFRQVEEVLLLLDPTGNPAKVNLSAGRHARRRAGKIFVE